MMSNICSSGHNEEHLYQMVHEYQRLPHPHLQRADRFHARHTDHPPARNGRAQNGTVARNSRRLFLPRREISDRRVELGKGQTRGLVFESPQKPACEVDREWTNDSR